MKRILLVIFALISLNAFSQLQVKEGSFKYVPGGVIDDKEEYTDGNDLPMALIKISTENIQEQERMRLVFVGNRATQIIKKPKTGSMWIYISAEAATFIDIRHPDYGTYKYRLPEELCDYCVYEMVLQYIESKPELGFLAISSEPTDADIYIDGKHYGKTNNVITDLAVGTHELKLEKEGYSTVIRTFVTTKGETLKLNETLHAVVNKKTYLIVQADQPDAIVYIDGEMLGAKEARKLVDDGTTHTYKIECKLYHEESGTVTVKDKTVVNKTLRPAFGYLNISSTPEQGANVWVDGELIGVTPIKTDKLASGSHTVRVMKDMYKMTEKSFTVTDGQTTNATLNMSANFVTLTLTVDADTDSDSDSDSDIYVDEEYKGKGKWTGRLSEGAHIFEARKANHKPSKKSLDLVMGENKTITLDAPTPINGTIDVDSSPMGATIYIDGKHYGETPNYISDILIGEHELKLTKQGCAPITKTINIKEGETLKINEKLQSNSQQPTANSQKTSGNNNVASGKINGHEYVDLGLSVKWATCNVGASSPEDYGNYYAWGETTTKSDYSSSNSKTYGKSINDIKGNFQYDAARASWGGDWRMPTKEEMQELIDKCTWTWTKQNGVNGFKVTSKTNGNSIFLPAAGCRYRSSLIHAGSYGGYWSSMPFGSSSNYAYVLFFYSSDQNVEDYYPRYGGQSVRPVLE